MLVLVVETQVAENVTFKQLYNQAMTPAENYHRTMGVWSFIEFGLERHSLDRFADLYTGYDHDLAVLKERLALFEAV